MSNDKKKRPVMTDGQKEVRRRELTRNMPVYAVVFLIVSALLFGTAAVIISVSLHKTNPELITDSSVFVCNYGKNTVKVSPDKVVSGNTVYVDMTQLSQLCSFKASGDANSMRFTAENGDFIIFYNASAESGAVPTANVGGKNAVMSAFALISDGVCRVPMDFLASVVDGVTFSVDTEKYVMTVNRNELPLSTKAEPLYQTVGFSIKGNAPLEKPLTFLTDISAFELFMNPFDATPFLTVISKTHAVAADYAPSALTALPSSICNGKEIQLSEYAAKSAEAMMKELYAAGYKDITVTSGYRSYDYQSGLFNTYISQEMANNPSLTRDEAEKVVLTYSAEPGKSEHHSGLCIDLISSSMTQLDESFANLGAYSWLSANAWKFGFILRYPESKTDITGYDFEPWHYRYVGRDAAKRIHDAGICLEEYLGN